MGKTTLSRGVKPVARVRFAANLLALLGLFCAAPLHAVTPVSVEFAASSAYFDRPITLQAQLYRPEGDGPFPAAVLMHGCGGMLPAARAALHSYAEFLVQNGYVALSLDSFGPRGNGDGWVCAAFERLGHARQYRVADALDARQYLRALDFVDADNIFQMGQSNGGSVAIRLAQLEPPAFRATVAFYPWCGAFERAGGKAVLTSPLLVLGGASDDWTPPDECETVATAGAEYRVVVYPGAVHSFDLEIPRQLYQGHQVGYEREAARDSRRQMLEFFDAHRRAARSAGIPRRAGADPEKARGPDGLEIAAGAAILELY